MIEDRKASISTMRLKYLCIASKHTEQPTELNEIDPGQGHQTALRHPARIPKFRHPATLKQVENQTALRYIHGNRQIQVAGGVRRRDPSCLDV